MDVHKAIKISRSVREYSSKPVEEEKLKKILESARLAPAASNRQEWRFVVVKDEETRQKLADSVKTQSTGKEFIAQAPVVVACCAQTDEHFMKFGPMNYPVDVTVAIIHMTLQASELELGTCWISGFYADRVRKILDIPKEIKIFELLTLGYPSHPLVEKITDQPELESIIFNGKWNN
ncbi:nitroreductase family protein [Elusimicrobiota bacterium]